MKKKLGEYYFVCRNGWFKIYKVTGVTDNGCSASQVWGEKGYQDPYDAYARTCELNGKKPVAKERFAWTP